MNGLNLTAQDYKTKLHMPFAGVRGKNASLSGQGNYGYYWLSTSSDSGRSRYLKLVNSYVYANNEIERAEGHSVRLFLDEYIEPDNTRTVEE
jgi:hypothetical protein